MGCRRLDAPGQVIGRDELGMLARDQQHIAEALRHQMARLGLHLVEREGDPQDRIIAREPAILADVDALVGEIKRREQPHGAPEKLPRQSLRLRRDGLQLRPALRLKQRGEALQHARLQ